MGLAAAAVINNDIKVNKESQSVSICPGPNLAYFSKYMSLKEMSNQIYGMSDSITRVDRPHMFLKELDLYINFLSSKLEEASDDFNKKQVKYFTKFTNNLYQGLDYYSSLFKDIKVKFKQNKNFILADLDRCKLDLKKINSKIEDLIKTSSL